MDFNLIKINNDNLYVLKNLFQLYIHDISKELSWNVNNDGNLNNNNPTNTNGFRPFVDCAQWLDKVVEPIRMSGL